MRQALSQRGVMVRAPWGAPGACQRGHRGHSGPDEAERGQQGFREGAREFSGRGKGEPGTVTGRRLERQAEWLRPAGTGRGGQDGLRGEAPPARRQLSYGREVAFWPQPHTRNRGPAFMCPVV